MLVLPDALLCLALTDRVIHAFSVPELSPCHIGKVKDVTEMSELTQVDNPKVKNKHDKIIVYTTSKIRVVQFLPDRIKLLKDINYSGAIIGYSSAAGTLANYSNICLVANNKNYDVVDLQQTRRISLFDYNADLVQNVGPHIVPFTAKDKPKLEEEYLLTISSDASTSMAMFVNAFGEVTRGTLTWIGNGYPTNGIAVEWPYAIGLFTNPADDKLKLTFSSLESFDVVVSQELHLSDFGVSELEKLHLLELKSDLKVVNRVLLDLLSPVDASGKPVKNGQKFYSTTRSILFAENAFFFLHKTEDLVTVFDGLIKSVEEVNAPDELADISSEIESVPNFENFTKIITILLLLVIGKESEFKERFSKLKGNADHFDPRLLLLLYDGFSDEIWTDFSIEGGLFTLIDKLKFFSPNEDLKVWLIDEVYSNREFFNLTIWLYFRVLKYKNQHDDSATIALINTEKDQWTDGAYENDDLIKHIKDKSMDLSLLHVYKIEQAKGIKDRGAEIIDLSLELLRREDLQEQLEKSGQEETELIKVAFFQLRNNTTDADEYTKRLLELLKLRPDEGLDLLRENKGGKHKATHHYILKELSKTHALNSDFSSLKIEYIELNFVESIKDREMIDYELLEELLSELLHYLSSSVTTLEEEVVNFEILISTFKVDTNNGGWPKLSLADFLHVHGRRSECKDLAIAYLKVYELLVAKRLHDEEKFTWKGLEHPTFAYLQNGFSAEPNKELILYMLKEENDYCVAETLCIYPGMPFPKQTVYFESIRGKFAQPIANDKEVTKSNLQTVLGYYLQLPNPVFRFAAISHMVELFGDAYFSMEEVLNILPEDTPLWYVNEYFARNVVEKENKRAFASTVKMLTKLDSKFTHQVAQDFERTYGGVLDKNE